MSSRTDREAMAAALGGMVSRAEEPSAPASPATPPTKPAASKPRSRPAKTKPTSASPRPKRVAKETKEANEDQSHDQAHRKTGIGYVKADGTEMVRTVVMLTKSERRRLKILALQAGLSPSDYVRRAVGFLDE